MSLELDEKIKTDNNRKSDEKQKMIDELISQLEERDKMHSDKINEIKKEHENTIYKLRKQLKQATEISRAELSNVRQYDEAKIKDLEAQVKGLQGSLISTTRKDKHINDLRINIEDLTAKLHDTNKEYEETIDRYCYYFYFFWLFMAKNIQH